MNMPVKTNTTDTNLPCGNVRHEGKPSTSACTTWCDSPLSGNDYPWVLPSPWCYPRIETLVVGSHLVASGVRCRAMWCFTCDQASEYLQASANHPEFTVSQSQKFTAGYGWKRRWRMNRPTWRIMFTWFWGVCHFEQLVQKGWGWKLRSYETCRR